RDYPHPFGLVSHLLRNPKTGRLTLFSFSKVLEEKDGKWEQVQKLKLEYRRGRPDAVGSYPAITQAEFLDSERILTSTIADGFLLIDKSGVRQFRISGQLNMP